MSLKDKVTVITGASRGIGRALALGFAAEGAFVVAAARTQRTIPGAPEGSLEETVRRITDAGGWALPVPCDVADESQVRALIERTLAEVGPIDVLINNAGLYVVGPITKLAVADWDMVMAVNLRGPFLLCRQVAPGMMDRQRGSIVNISSSSASGDETGSVVYGPSKAALDRFTLNLALDLKPYNISVNGLRPGLIASAMTADSGQAQQRWGSPSEPEEVIPAAVWLAQQDASTFTGHIVRRDEFGSAWP